MKKEIDDKDMLAIIKQKSYKTIDSFDERYNEVINNFV